MNYEVVCIEEKVVAGIAIRTSNSDPDMPRTIGKLWQRFYENGVYQSIPDKKNYKSIGLYTNYESDVNGAYDVMVCCEISKSTSLPTGIDTRKIPAGSYAKFVVCGNMQKAVADFWGKLWTMDLDRKYSSDFEEYQSDSDLDNAEIHIYIALK
jgi:predicted transcriptional regulator YdeE